MTSDAKNKTQKKSGDEDSEKTAKKSPLLMGVLMIAVVVGGGFGGFTYGPKLVASIASQKNEAEASGASEAESDPEHAEESHEDVTGKFLELENLLVNPAGSRGERFLMVSVAFEVPDDEALEHLHEREIQIRDAVSATLEALTLDDLTHPGVRDTLKQDLLEVVKPFSGEAAWVRVYLPRFVIQ
jgi:flagellar FliL protein